MMNSWTKLVTATTTVAAVAAVFGCSELTSNDSDQLPPTIKLAKLDSSIDSVLQFTATVHDNLGIKRVHIETAGIAVPAFDSTFTSSSTDATITLSLAIPASVPAGTTVTVFGTAYDGVGNASVMDTLRLAVGNLAPGSALITSPASGTVVVQGKSAIISISGKSAVKVRGLGFQTSGAFVAADSTIFSSPLLDSTSSTDTIAIPTTAATGSLVVTPFVLDSLGQRALGTPITLSVQTPSSAVSVPTVTFGTTSRVEVADTIHVDASDPNGIKYVGYEVRLTPNSSGAPVVRDSLAFSGDINTAFKTFSLALPASLFSSFPTPIYVRAFAVNGSSAGTRGYAKLGSGAMREDTLTVVAGVTRSLPLGGSVADALYHTGRDQLFLTNIDRNTLEVFNLADSSFKRSINVGSRPWGIAAWPRDHNGTMGDTILVANSGGTDISYVDLTTMHEVSAIQEQAFASVPTPYRYALPNIIAYSVTTVAAASTGLPIQQRKKYDFSDRPQFLGATCRGFGTACGDVLLTYSTTPTPGQTQPFSNNNGTLRWENLTQTTVDRYKSHLFFEQAVGESENTLDTLEVERYDAVLRPIDAGYLTVPVPSAQLVIGPTGDTVQHSYSVIVDVPKLAFRDTTYVRNSGNFQRAVFGEGGPIQNSRSMTYDASYGYETIDPDSHDPRYTLTIPVIDLGVSGAFNISNFIANNSQRVSGVATNFDGSLSAIRGDSTYLIKNNLILQGILPTTPSNSGLDFHPNNTGLNPAIASRLIFTASADANLEVWDTGCYQRVATVPIRDPIVGPIKAALRQVSGKLILFGVTSKGVVIVTLPNDFHSSCS